MKEKMKKFIKKYPDGNLAKIFTTLLESQSEEITKQMIADEIKNQKLPIDFKEAKYWDTLNASL